MATPTPTPKPTARPGSKPGVNEADASKFPNTHTEGGFGTKQDFDKEPRAEDLPADAKITPPLEQVNTAAARAVGTAGDVSYDEADEAVQAGIDAHKKSQEKAEDSAKS